MTLFSRLAAATVLAGLAVTTAHAAPVKAKQSKAAKNAAKTTSKSKAIVPAVAVSATQSENPTGIQKTAADANSSADGQKGFSSATTTLNTSSTNPSEVTTSTANLAEQIKAASPRTVFGELYAETYAGLPGLQNGTGSPQIDAYAGAKFDLGGGNSIAVRQAFDYKGFSATGEANETHVQDLYVNYTIGKLATILGDGALTFISRTYLPTGENSRDRGNLGAERLYLIGSKSFGKLDLAYVVLGQYTNWTRDNFTNARKAGSPLEQNRWGYLAHELDVFYNITPMFAVGSLFGNENLYFRPQAGNPNEQSDFYIQPTVQMTIGKGLVIQASLYNEINIGHPTQDFAAMRNDELAGYLNLAASL